MIPLLILAEHRLTREGWASFLSMQMGISIIGHTGDADEALRMIAANQPQIVLMAFESNLPALLNRLIRFHYQCLRASFVLITAEFPEGIKGHLGPLSVRACLSKDSSLLDLLAAIATVNSGKTYVSSAFSSATEYFTRTADVSSASLSSRELRIAALLVCGKTSKDIAETLNISQRTVDVHRHNILKKMKCKNTLMLINKLSFN